MCVDAQAVSFLPPFLPQKAQQVVLQGTEGAGPCCRLHRPYTAAECAEQHRGCSWIQGIRDPLAEEKHGHRVTRDEDGEGFQAEGTIRQGPEGVEGRHAGAALWLEARPCRRQGKCLESMRGLSHGRT